MIFKYLPITDGTLSNISARNIPLRHYADFNDPFEFWSRICTGIPDRITERDRYLKAIETWGGTEEDEVEVPEFFDSLTDLQPGLSSLYDRARLGCFGSAADNMLMWSHYADGLRGICLGYDEALITSAADGFMLDVRYAERPPVVDEFVYAVAVDQVDYHQMAIEEESRAGKLDYISAYQEAEQQARNVLLEIWQSAFATKPLCWAYEKERRLLVNRGSGAERTTILEYSPEAIQFVAIGERADANAKSALLSCLRRAGVQCDPVVASRSTDDYRIALD